MLRMAKKIVRGCLSFLPDHLVGTISFETKAFLRNSFSPSLKLDASKRNLINLGSGPKIVQGLINIDFFTTSGIDYGADLRRPLKIADDTVDGIFCEHTMEHLTYDETGRLLRECFRIMKPGAVIRIILPDISLFLKHYCAKDDPWFKRWERLIFLDSPDAERAKRRLATPMQAISFVTQEYGHVSAWDIPTITYFLEQSGFRHVEETSFMKGQNPELLIDLDEEERKFVSLYVEAKKQTTAGEESWK